MSNGFVLVGSYGVEVDHDGRVQIPAEWREGFDDDVVYVALDRQDRSILIIPSSEARSLGDAEVKSVRLGKDLHVALPPQYLDCCGITTKAVMVGAVRAIKMQAPEELDGNADECGAELDKILKNAGF